MALVKISQDLAALARPAIHTRVQESHRKNMHTHVVSKCVPETHTALGWGEGKRARKEAGEVRQRQASMLRVLWQAVNLIITL